jgi:HPt (histidine-containing phosphotransfer) domain-containing protein
MPSALTGPLFDAGQIALLRGALGDDELLAMLAELPAAVGRATDRIREAVEAADLNGARRAAHVLKGVASSFGAAGIAELALRFETEHSLASIADGLPVLGELIGQTASVIGTRVEQFAGAGP